MVNYSFDYLGINFLVYGDNLSDAFETAMKGPGFKVSYKELKKCVLKKEVGEETQDCKSIFKELNIQEV